MHLMYYQGNNFGDKLNPFIFFALFDYVSFAESHPDHIVMGLGSILSDTYLRLIPKGCKAIPFGSGVRSPDITVSENVMPVFVRGPVSAKSLNCEYIADTAYLFPLLKDYEKYMAMDKKHKLSIMPYFRHMDCIDWKSVEENFGVHVIDPTGPLLAVLNDIATSEYVVAGAMHGCILADVFRIPWARLRFRTHEFEPLVQDVKWLDWALSINIVEYPTFKLKTENHSETVDKKSLEKELVACLENELDFASFALSSADVFDEIACKLKKAAKHFSAAYSITINQYRTTGLA